MSVRLEEFDVWRPGYGNASVSVFIGGTSTLASIFTDQALTQAASNPQTLLELEEDGVSFGKWAQPLYVGQPYYLEINSVDQTGVVGVPLTTLQGEDASEATVVPTGSSVPSALEDLVAQTVNVNVYGQFLPVGAPGASASNNTATLNLAIADAAARGGAFVVVPAGAYQITSVILAAKCVLVGQGRDSTSLQSLVAGAVVTIGGTRAGLAHLNLNGVSQVNNSIGLYALLQEMTVMEDVLIQNFDTGVELVGGSIHTWRDFYISNCVTGFAGYGSSNGQAGGPGGGGPFEYFSWDGGFVQFCSGTGILIEGLDELCDHNAFGNIAFNSNTGIAFAANGARATLLKSCSWNGNTTDLSIADGSPLNAEGTNTTIGFECQDGAFIDGAINLYNTLQNVAFRRCEFTNITFNLNAPANNVLLQDCRQIDGVSFAGASQAVISSYTYNRGATVGLTTGNTDTTAWRQVLQSGQVVFLEATAVGRCRNNVDVIGIRSICAAYCSGATLAYSSNTASFTAGNVLTGQTSGATARITVVTASGSAGTLTLQDIDGTFNPSEIITDSGGGSATTNGAIAPGTVTVATPTNQYVTRTDANWVIAFAASGQDVIVNVTGDTSMNVEWFVDVEVLSTQQIE